MTRAITARLVLLVTGLAVVVALIGATAGCKRAKGPVTGMAGYEVGKTRLGAVAAKNPRCGAEGEGGKLTRCYHPGSLRIAERDAVLELLFDGKSTDSLLIEILAEVPGCRFASLDGQLTQMIGEPTERGEKRLYWAQEFAFIAAREVTPARCEVTFVEPDDHDRITSLKK